METDRHLNLARLWRPTTFDAIIGQETPVRMLKNALYKNAFFPVYLFAGQHGCGKTSTARIFAAAINCASLATWQTNPQNLVLPCLKCLSCLQMAGNKHPDFIEIDAASHTGVDDVRTILEASFYLPLMGLKKIYLIDEAHMLSKSAFNAFLKILEEPPASVVFMLATTDIQKIPETIRSRCFQLFLDPLKGSFLQAHLEKICQTHNLSIEHEALSLIVRETGGSARDAINLLEKVRFYDTTVTKEIMLAILGKISEEKLYELFGYLVAQKPLEVVHFFKNHDHLNLHPARLWYMVIELVRDVIHIKVGIPPASAHLGQLAAACSLNRLHAMLQFFWNQEELFLKTTHKRLFLESTLIHICQQVAVKDIEELIAKAKALPVRRHETSPERPIPPLLKQQVGADQTHDETTPGGNPASFFERGRTENPDDETLAMASPPSLSEHDQTGSQHDGAPWQTFITQIAELNDQLLLSIFKGMHSIKHLTHENIITASLDQEIPFFRDKLRDTERLWRPFFDHTYPGMNLQLIKGDTTTSASKTTHGTAKHYTSLSSIPEQSPNNRDNGKPEAVRPSSFALTKRSQEQPPKNAYQKQPPARQKQYIDISDKEKWPKANLIAQYFSTKIEKR